MNTQILSFINLGVSLVAILSLFWLLFKIRKLDRIRKEFMPSGLGKDLEQVLVEQNRSINKLRSDLTTLNEDVQDLTIVNQSNFQKIGFVRFNPFDDAGGNISFTLSLLNGKNDGVVISSLHGREGTRVYAKSVKAGNSESKLTQEESDALTQAK
jgi:hypothetical protein